MNIKETIKQSLIEAVRKYVGPDDYGYGEEYYGAVHVDTDSYCNRDYVVLQVGNSVFWCSPGAVVHRMSETDFYWSNYWVMHEEYHKSYSIDTWMNLIDKYIECVETAGTQSTTR